MGDRLPRFEYHLPATLAEAVGLLTKLEGAVILQGGTDLLVAAKLKGLKPQHVVSLKKLRRTLGRVREKDGSILIGASSTFDTLEKSELVQKRLPVLLDAARLVGSQQIRNAATIGGNLCNGSPAADSAPPLLVLAATLKVRGAGGEKRIPIEEFFKGPGKTALKKGDILTEIAIPRLGPGSGAAFVKMGRRVSEDIAVVSAAAFIVLDGKVAKNVRIALGSVAPTPMRARKTEEFLRGRTLSDGLVREAGDVAMSECSPIDDVRASAGYRRKMVGVLSRSAIKEAIRRASGERT